MSIVIDTPDALEHFQFARCIAMLRIEVSTGLKHSQGSVLKHVQKTYVIRSRTKKGALREMEVLYKTNYGREYGL